MRIDYKWGEEKLPQDITLDDTTQDVEIREAFAGVTFVSEEGEKLSISMRDYGFEAHYYTDPDDDGKSFDAGWFRFCSGVVNDDKPEPTEQTHIPTQDRLEVWVKAGMFVDRIIELHPLEPYRVGAPFGTGSTMTPAEQRINLIRDVANWLLGVTDD